MPSPRARRRTHRIGMALPLVCVLLPGGLAAQIADAAADPDQIARILGQVLDRRSGDALASARVEFLAPDGGAPLWSTTTDEDGEFRTPLLSLGAFVLQVEAESFLRVSQPIQIDEPGVVDVRVEMVRVDYELDAIVATARRRGRMETSGFYDRRAAGLGYSMTRAEIEESGAVWTSELLRRIPGTRVVGGSTTRGNQEVFLRGGGDPGCRPLFVVDGAIVELVAGQPWDINGLANPSDLDGIEVLAGAARTPIQYQAYTSCGVVMLWTRDLMMQEGGSFWPSWRKTLLAVGLAGLAFFATR